MEIPNEDAWITYEEFIGRKFARGKKIQVIAGSNESTGLFNCFTVFPESLLFLRSSNGTVVSFIYETANGPYTGYISGPFVLKELRY